jgi:SAM-dependent methyltransferase
MSSMSEPIHSFDPVWDRVFQQQAWGKYPPEYVIRFVAQSFYRSADRRAVRILDLGSGPGAISWYVAREGFSAAAIDGSPTAIEQLRARLAGESLEVDAKVGDIVELPWPDASFDAVIDNLAITHNRFQMARRIADEVHRVLKPGGRFCSASFTDRTWGYGAGRALGPGELAEVDDGPLAGRGTILFMGRAQVDQLYRRFDDCVVDTYAWTVEGRKHLVELWVVTCRKQT